jgi:uncharacterized protein YfbU (UPF0304 family)|nr:MAG TPA: YfbU domain protein [Caudoviricetes sp.]
MDNKFELTEKERLSYILQLEILEKLSPEKHQYTELKDALSNGFTYHYNDLVDFFLDNNELSIEESRLVLDILEMYRGLIFSATKLGWENMGKVTFLGFDGNDSIEAKMRNYVRYLIEELGRYDEIKKFSNMDYNSHSEMLPKYKRMLSLFNEIPQQEKYSMNENVLNSILNV